jgi:hypothetical protein
MSHGVLVQEKVAALNIDSLNRSCYSACAIDNGNVFQLKTKVPAATLGTTGSEVWLATMPETGSMVNLWMAYEPEVVVTVSGTQQYKGIDPDPRNFYNISGNVFSAFRPQLGDLLLMTADCMSSTVSSYAVAADTAFVLAWSAVPAIGLTLKYVGLSYISIGTGSVGTQRVAAYKFEVVAI